MQKSMNKKRLKENWQMMWSKYKFGMLCKSLRVRHYSILSENQLPILESKTLFIVDFLSISCHCLNITLYVFFININFFSHDSDLTTSFVHLYVRVCVIKTQFTFLINQSPFWSINFLINQLSHQSTFSWMDFLIIQLSHQSTFSSIDFLINWLSHHSTFSPIDFIHL